MEERGKVVLAPYPRTMSEIFGPTDLERLNGFADVLWARDEALSDEALHPMLEEAWALVSFSPTIGAAELRRMQRLRAIVEVGGHFPSTIDYEACFARGIRVLSCAPAFASQVAEMALAMTLASARGLVSAHIDVVTGREEWQGDKSGDFSLFGRTVGFVGFGSIARELLALLAPFKCRTKVFDPWLPSAVVERAGGSPTSLEYVMAASDVVYVLATPTPENRGLISRELIASMKRDSLLVLVSRAHLVDFDAMVEAAESGLIRAAVDVFPEEPLPEEALVRRASNVVLSPHRAASIRVERRSIGRMAVDDLEQMSRGLPPSMLQVAQPEIIKRRLAPPNGQSVRKVAS